MRRFLQQPEIVQDSLVSQPDTLGSGRPDTVSLPVREDTPVYTAPLENPVPEVKKELRTPYYLRPEVRQDSQVWFQQLDEKPNRFRKQELWTGTSHQATGSSPGSLDIKPKAEPVTSDWILGVVIISLIPLIWVRLFFNKYFNLLLVSLSNYQISTKVFRDQNQLTRRVNFVLNLNFLLIGGLFLYQITKHFNLESFPYKPGVNYLLYTALIAALLIARYLVSHITAYLFREHRLFREYLFNIYLIYKALGIFLIPVVITVNYVQESLQVYFLYAGILFAAAALLLRIIRGVQLLLKKDVLMFYLILYLCTLEFLPVLLLYKYYVTLTY